MTDGLLKTVRHKDPEWTPEQIIKIRKIYRSGGTVSEVVELLGTKMNPQAVRDRAIKLGMRFIVVPRNHLGTSKSVQREKPLGDRHK